MRVGVEVAGQTISFEIAEERLIAQWSGPEPRSPDSLQAHIRAVLEDPLGYPALRLNVVPGDRVVIPFDPGTPDIDAILVAICEILMEAGVEASSIVALATEPSAGPTPVLPEGVRHLTHDPSNAEEMSYLAASAGDRRLYLNRLATDADVVIPVGILGYGTGLSARGPWTEIFPGLSNQETRDELQAISASPDTADHDTILAETAEVSWLLGSQFQIGVEVGARGATGILAGLDQEVLRRGVDAIEAAWSIRIDTPAHLVLAGVGVPWKPTSLDDLARGIEVASQLVRSGGKIVVFTELAAAPGRALQYMAELEDPRLGPHTLRGLEELEDYAIAIRLARALVHADIYLYSRIDIDLVESLGIIALDRPEDARKLVEQADSCLAISPAEWVRGKVVESRSTV